MATLNYPTFTYPNGGESIFSRAITISWQKPSQASPDGDPVWYDIFFTDDWQALSETTWKQISTVPAEASSFVWNIRFPIHSNTCRLGIRSRDNHGNISDMGISADVFSIQDKQISSPALVSPEEAGYYHQYVPIILDHDAVLGTYSQRALYQIYYSSEANNIDWTLVKQNVPVGSAPFLWDIRDIPMGNDYQIKVVLLDDKGNSSLPVFVRNLKISPMDYFLIDTIAPKGKIKIQGGKTYASDRNVIVQLTAFDETTDVKSVTMEQSFNDVTTTGSEQEMANIKTWYLSGTGDGVRCISAKFKDFAGNTVSDSSTEEFFRTYVDSNNASISAFLPVKTGDDLNVYTAFGGTPKIFKNKEVYISSISNEVTSMELFSGVIYVGSKTSSSRGVLYKISNDALVAVYSFGSLDSAITSLAVYDSKLYIGCQNGDVYSYNETSVTYVYSFATKVQSMYSDGNRLYIHIDNDPDIFIYNGVSVTTNEVANATIQY